MERRKTRRPLSKIFAYMKILYVSQLILTLGLLVTKILVYINIINTNIFSTDTVFILFGILILLNTWIMMGDIKRMTGLSDQITIKDNVLNDIKNLNNTLRAQRHDFLNHIQVIYSLVEMKEYEEVSDYLNQLYGDIQGLNQHIKTDHVAINALLLAKSNSAKEQGINYEVDIKSKLSELVVPSWEMCRCLGNLIDNAITIVKENKNDKTVKISLRESISFYYIEVINNGKPIPENIRNAIFEAGFTTKAGDGHGMGLYIVKSIIGGYGGAIEVISDEEETSFTLTLPKS